MAKLNAPVGLRPIGSSIYIADKLNHRIRQVETSFYNTSTINGYDGKWFKYNSGPKISTVVGIKNYSY